MRRKRSAGPWTPLLIAPDSAVSPWAIRLRLGSGERSTIGVSRAEYCPPVAAAADVRSESYVGPVSAADLARAEADARRLQQQWRQMQEYVGRAWVSSDGQVTVVEAVERSGNRVADREAETMLRRNRF